MKRVAVAFAYLIGAFFVARAFVEVVTVHWGDAASYRNDWGGPTLVGVLAVHGVPGLIAAGLMLRALLRRRSQHPEGQIGI
jgi:hypothetical protein